MSLAQSLSGEKAVSGILVLAEHNRLEGKRASFNIIITRLYHTVRSHLVGRRQGCTTHNSSQCFHELYQQQKSSSYLQIIELRGAASTLEYRFRIQNNFDKLMKWAQISTTKFNSSTYEVLQETHGQTQKKANKFLDSYTTKKGLRYIKAVKLETSQQCAVLAKKGYIIKSLAYKKQKATILLSKALEWQALESSFQQQTFRKI